MCGRFVFDLSPADFEAFFHVVHPLSVPREPRYNIAPTQEVLVIANVPGAGPRAGRMHWGFFPADPPPGKRPPLLINARAETVHRLPSFRTAFRRGRRCLIPASGWYEWQPLGDGRGGKQPMFIRRADREPLAFAGLWERWQPPSPPGAKPVSDATELSSPSVGHAPAVDRSSEPASGAQELSQPPTVCSVVIITAAAAPGIAAIHDRMPLALAPSRWEEWLLRREPELPATWLQAAREEVAANFPFVATPVSNRVNSPRHDDAACLADASAPPRNPL